MRRRRLLNSERRSVGRRAGLDGNADAALDVADDRVLQELTELILLLREESRREADGLDDHLSHALPVGVRLRLEDEQLESDVDGIAHRATQIAACVSGWSQFHARLCGRLLVPGNLDEDADELVEGLCASDDSDSLQRTRSKHF